MFPGQPVSFAGMPVDDPLFCRTTDLCRTVTGWDPRLSDASASGVSESVRLQLFGTVMSLYRCDQLIGAHGLPGMIAEHSLGVYAALAATGSIDCTSALELTGRIGICLATMAARSRYALGSVVGLPGEPLAAIAANNGVFLANCNTSRHFLLAGEREGICSATAEAEAAGAFSTGVFNADAPLHTPLLQAVAGDLQAIVADYTYREPRIPVMNHLDQTLLKGCDIPRFLVEELCHPVYWERTYRALKQAGVERFFEAGAGQALTKFNRWIDSDS